MQKPKPLAYKAHIWFTVRLSLQRSLTNHPGGVVERNKERACQTRLFYLFLAKCSVSHLTHCEEARQRKNSFSDCYLRLERKAASAGLV